MNVERMTPREKLIESISDDICKLALSHTVRVGVDGITASGKSTFAKELFEKLSQKGKPCVLTTLDGFHNPKSVRYQKGRESAEGYYWDAYNCSAILENLLNPLGPNGSGKYRLKSHDLKEDCPLDLPFSTMASGGILIVDGSFALRKELRDFWDFKIYVKVDFEIALQRASIRDAEFFGSPERAREITKKRYNGAHAIHNVTAGPWSVADVVIDNNDPQAPRFLGPF